MNRAITTRIAERRIAERRAARRRRRAEPPLELFDGIEWDDALIQAPRQRGDLVRLWRWIRRHQLPAQAVLIVGLLTVAYLLLIFGILLGVAVEIDGEFLASDRWQVERKRRIVIHSGCGAGLIREATRGNTSLPCESGTFRNRSLRNLRAGA